MHHEHLVNRYANTSGTNQAENLNDTGTLCSSITAVCVPIEFLLQNTTPTRLPFDRIGILHPDIGASTGSLLGLKYARSPVLSSDFWSAGSSTTYNTCLGGASLIPASDLKIRIDHSHGTSLQHRAPRRDAGPQTTNWVCILCKTVL